MKRSSFLGMCLAVLPGAALLRVPRNTPTAADPYVAAHGAVQAPLINSQCGTQLRGHLFRIAEGASGFKPTWADFSRQDDTFTVMLWDEHWRAVRKTRTLHLHASVGLVGRESESAYQICKATHEAGIDLAELNGHDWQAHRKNHRWPMEPIVWSA